MRVMLRAKYKNLCPAERQNHRPAEHCSLSKRCPRLRPLGACSAAEETLHRLRHRVGLLELRQVAGALDQRDPRAGDALGELLRVGGSNDAVVLAPDDQARRGDAMGAMLEAA